MNYIVIDLLGSDKGPSAILEGIDIVLKEHDNIGVTIVGPIEVAKKFIEDKKLDDFTHNKAIQKARESFRVSNERKCILG